MPTARRATWSGSQRCSSTFAARPCEVDVGQPRVVGAAGGDHDVVDRRRQLVEEPLEALEVGGVERRTAQRAELACGVLEAFRVAAGENDIGALGPCSPGRLEPDPRAAADHDDRLPGELRPAAHVGVAHVGSSVPACSATMYAAYQSGQFASRCPVRFSCSPWAASARRSALARSLRRREGRRRGVDATGQPGRDLLEQPAVAVRITERGERAVAAMLGIRTADPDPPKQIGLVRAGVHAVAVEHFADLDAAIEQLFAGGLDVGDDQVQALGGAGRRRGDVLAEDDRAPGAGRRELDHAEVFTVVVVGVEPPPELRVELLRAVDIRDGDDDDLELHVDWRDAGVDTADCVGAHSCLLSCVIFFTSRQRARY